MNAMKTLYHKKSHTNLRNKRKENIKIYNLYTVPVMNVPIPIQNKTVNFTFLF